MNELLLILGSWISLLLRPLVALQIDTTGCMILTSHRLVHPRISRNKPRLLFVIDTTLWVILRLHLH